MKNLINEFYVYEFSLPLFKIDFIFQLNNEDDLGRRRTKLLKKIKYKKSLHLVIEGIANSNEYLHLYIYHILENFKKGL